MPDCHERSMSPPFRLLQARFHVPRPLNRHLTENAALFNLNPDGVFMGGHTLLRSDKLILSVFAITILSFLFSGTVSAGYASVTATHPLLAGFTKFALLATFGECLALRLRSGRYLAPGFGLLPKALVWGILGMGITIAFAIFARGVPPALAGLSGEPAYAGALGGPFGWGKLAVAFGISVTLNLFFAPVLMVAHKLSDLHIAASGGSLHCLVTLPDIPGLFRQINWNIMWSFVLARTIPCFWIPAHTVTFLLPESFRVLFAALLGAALGVFLAWKK